MKVLHIEDVDINIKMVEQIVTFLGHELVVARTGMEGLKLISEQEDIDLALVDIRLPDIIGYEVIRQIHVERPELPIIAVTAYALALDRQKCLEAGASDYIAKPFRFDMLTTILKRYDQ